MLATVTNMRKLPNGGKGVIAYSSHTSNEYTANPDFYFWLDPEEVMLDMHGHQMELVHKIVKTTYKPVEEDE